MTTTLDWTAYDTIVTAMDTGLSTLATNGLCISSNFASPSLHIYMDVEACVSTVDISAQVNPAIYLWVLARTDGTNYEDGGSAVTPSRQPDAILPLRAVNTAQQRVSSRLILTTPDQFKLLYKNVTNTTLNSGVGNTLKFLTYSISAV